MAIQTPSESMGDELREWKAHARKQEGRARHWRATLINVRVMLHNGQLRKALEALEELRPAVEKAVLEEQQRRTLDNIEMDNN